MITELPKLWTEEEVARHFGVCPDTIARERRSGQLGFTRLRGRIRYTAAHIAAYLELQECASTSSPAKASGKSAGPMMLDARSANQRALEIAGKPNLSSPRTS